MNYLDQPNYQLWNLKPTDFTKLKRLSDQLRFIATYGTLAPSSHNTQPWTLIIKDNVILIHADLSRRLKAADPTNKELYISVGCTIPLIEIAASQYGFTTTTKLLPSPKNKNHIATITLTPSTKKSSPHPLFPFITKRLTNRAKYNPQKSIPQPVINELNSFLKNSPLSLHLYTDRPTITHLAKLTQKAMYVALSNIKFRDELASWVRHNWTMQGDGLPANTLGFPDAMSIILPTIVRSPLMAPKASEEEKKLITSSSAIGIITAPKDTLNYWVQSGHTYSLIALTVSKHKLAVEPLSATIEINKYTQALKTSLHLKYEPMMFFRIGYPKKPFPHAPRRPITEVVSTKS